MARKWGAFLRQFYSFLKRVKTYLIWSLLGLLLAGITPVSILAHSAHPTQVSQLPNISQQGSELVERGREFYETGDYQNAVTALTQARDLYRQQGKVLNEAIASSYLSLVYQKIGDWQAAERSILSSLEALPLTGGTDAERQTRALALNTKGQYQLQVGQAESAFETWEQAEQDYASVNDTKGILGTQINQALALEQMGHYRRSCNSLLKGLGVPGKTCDRLPKGEAELKEFVAEFEAIENLELRALGLRSLGNALRAIGQLEASEWVLNESLKLSDRLNSSELQSLNFLQLGHTLAALANRQKNYGLEAESKQTLEKAVQLYQKVTITADKPLLKVLANLGILQSYLSDDFAIDDEKISDLVATIQSELNTLNSSATLVRVRLDLACSLMNCNSLQENDRPALNFLSDKELETLIITALQDAETLNHQRLISTAKGTLAKYYEFYASNSQELTEKNWQEAKQLTEQALEDSEAIAARDLAYQWKWQLGRLLASQGNREGAISYYQKAIEDLDILRNDLLKIDPDIQFSFRDNVEQVYRDFVDLLLKNPKTENLNIAREQIDKLQLAQLENYLNCRLDSTVVPQKIIPPGTAVIYPIILRDRLEVIVELEGGKLYHYPPQLIEEASIESRLKEFRIELETQGFSQKGKNIARQIYDWLIAPGEQQNILNDETITLVFVLDGNLRSIPIGSLYDGEQYLIEKYAIALSLNLNIPVSQPPENLTTLLGGLSVDPQFRNLPELPAVKNELQTIQEIIQSEVLLDQDLTLNSLENATQFSDYPIVHLATHGQFSSNPQETFLIVYPDPSSNEDDRIIDLEELSNLLQRGDRRPIELLVLSACETAKNDNRATLGIAGVTIRAGARSTLASLWTVNDTSTATLMQEFYRNLIERGLTKAEALRQSQIKLLEQEYIYDDPLFWAPYVLVGNWESLFNS
ncbi:CHAT domain-containing tetratricopeptide repeat protein [Oxynema aestuarii]|uniref:CHAT domain-containing tetratricopeptide repeat protein n=1 Tax=Oxynema aestuarii TaxID=2874213 RepID=UPI001B309DD8|nr:CHAT domain-containing protein [Oxynema aestuarii]